MTSTDDKFRKAAGTPGKTVGAFAEAIASIFPEQAQPEAPQPTAGAMRAAEAIHRAITQGEIDTWDDDKMAAIIDRESGYYDLSCTAKELTDNPAFSAAFPEMASRIYYTLARVEGGGESA